MGVEEGSHGEEKIKTPLLDALMRAPDSYGSLNFATFYSEMLCSYHMARRPQILLIEGEIGVGKTTLTGELLRKIAYDLRRVGIDDPLPLHHGNWEGGQEKAKARYPPMRDHRPGSYTAMDYIQSHISFAEILRTVERLGGVNIIESLGLVRRGDTEPYMLSRRMRRAELPPFDLRAIFLTASDDVLEHSEDIRSHYDDPEADKEAILRSHGVTVFTDENSSRIGGGGKKGMDAFREELVNYLWELYTTRTPERIPSVVKEQVKERHDLYDPQKRMLFEEQFLTHQRYKVALGLPPSNVIALRNTSRIPVSLPQVDLDQFDISYW